MAPGTAPIPRADRPQRWLGRGASSGQAVGPARVLRTEADLAACGKGDILVMRHATPGVARAASRAAGLVSETGGLLSHLAVLARELGTPCVTGIPGIVDALESGVRISLDGSTGQVDALGAARTATAALPVPGSLTPILRFGRFSATFECEDATLTPEAVIRTAALAALPAALRLGGSLTLTFNGNVVLAETRPLHDLSHGVADQLEAAPDRSARARAAYDETLDWPGWHATRPDARGALERYVLLNSLTWAAALAKDELVVRLRRVLGAAATDDRRADELLLSSLTMPGASYLLAGADVGPGPDTLSSLELPSDAKARAQVLRDLVGLTEDKNTRLARLAAVMGRLPVARALGLTEAELTDDGTAEGRADMVQRAVDALPRTGLPL